MDRTQDSRWRLEKAEECERLAAMVSFRADKERLLAMAASWRAGANDDHGEAGRLEA